MELGKYYFVEKESPKYYKLDNTKHYFEIKENGKKIDSVPLLASEDIEKSDKEEILYNPFMQPIRNLWTPYWRYLMFGKENNQVHFYKSFREQCNLKSYMKYLDD